MARIHHTAICSKDIDASLRFWRDGLGFELIMDMPFEGDWPTLFGAPSHKLRSVFLGDPADADAGIIELVAFDGLSAASTSPAEAGATPPVSGFFLVSLTIDVDAALAQLASLGLGGEPRIIDMSGVKLAVVTDPDGVLVELMDSGASANLNTIISG